MEKVLEKSKLLYVLASIADGYCWYLKSVHGKGTYELVTDIEQSTKADKRSVMKILKEDYERKHGAEALELVMLPLVVEYSLIKEVDD